VRVAVVGHVEWVQFAYVPRLPVAGEIVHARSASEFAAGGGAVAAVQLQKLAGSCSFFTAVGDDELGRRAVDELVAMGLEVHAATRLEPQRRGFTHVDDDAERTITIIGERLVPHGADDLPWDELKDADAVYFTGGDVEALRAARQARVLVATPRARETLTAAGVELDALVRSGRDRSETIAPGEIDPPPKLIVATEGASGGHWTSRDGESGRWNPAPLPGRPVDAYGAGDSFAAGLTYGLGAGSLEEALELAARCGAACFTGAGPYEGQLTLDQRRDGG
jgi:ribokinase